MSTTRSAQESFALVRAIQPEDALERDCLTVGKKALEIDALREQNHELVLRMRRKKLPYCVATFFVQTAVIFGLGPFLTPITINAILMVIFWTNWGVCDLATRKEQKQYQEKDERQKMLLKQLQEI